MFKIGEFSKLTQVSIRMLRRYDEIGLLKPANIDPWTGYRMYDASQIPTLNKIKYLRDSGFHVAEIAAAMQCEDNQFMMKQLDQKQKEVKRNIQIEHEKLKKIELAKQELLQGNDEAHYNIFVKSVPSYPVLSLRKIIPNYYFESELWKEVSEFSKEHHIEITGDCFSIYHDEEYKEENVDVELCAIVRKTGKDIDPFKFRNTEPIPMMAYTMVYGSFSNIAKAYLTFAKWLEQHHHKMEGGDRQIVHRGPWNEAHPENYLTEIQIPLKDNENIL